MKNTIGFISLGCAKASYDTEQLLSKIQRAGYSITNSYQDSDLVIINTCGFVEDAIAESYQAIEDCLASCTRVIVTGCLAKYKNKITQKFPDLLAVTQDDQQVVKFIQQQLPLKKSVSKSFASSQTQDIAIKLTHKHIALLKIAEGCNQQCSFCVIPTMRGKLRSRSIVSIIKEAENFVKTGVKEILIIAQDTAAFGVDVRYRKELLNSSMISSDIVSLCKELGKLGVWVRLHYLYPYPKLDNLLELMADGIILPYLDVPLQHASPRILKLMRRPANTENMVQRIKQWRSICPDVSIRTTLITGFPSETEQDFDLLHDFIKTVKFDRLGVFTYSAVTGAKANEIKPHVNDEIKQIRQQILLDTQLDISEQKLQLRVGNSETVLVDELVEGGLIARSKYDSPEVDGVVHIHTTNQTIKSGDLISVKIIANDSHDLEAELICD